MRLKVTKVVCSCVSVCAWCPVCGCGACAVLEQVGLALENTTIAMVVSHSVSHCGRVVRA
jgi:hypothetical protein